MYKIIFYVPSEDVEAVKEACFAAGAGKVGNYEACCWQTLGTGQFRPLANANPALGEVTKLSHVEEYKVEMVCRDEAIADVVKAIHTSHPYETPAYQVIKCEEI